MATGRDRRGKHGDRGLERRVDALDHGKAAAAAVGDHGLGFNRRRGAYHAGHGPQAGDLGLVVGDAGRLPHVDVGGRAQDAGLQFLLEAGHQGEGDDQGHDPDGDADGGDQGNDRDEHLAALGQQIGKLRKILYGMPDPETFDFEKYAVGGCCIFGDGLDPDIRCRACEWSGFRDKLEAK